MELNTARFGKLEVKGEKIITFPQGIPGFENLTKYILLEEPDTNGAFYWLQSVEDGDISLLLTRPYLFTDYQIQLDRELLEDIGITAEGQGEVFTVVNVPDDFQRATTNLMAPIILNSDTMAGKQIILTDSHWPIKFPLFPQLQKAEGGK
ncbi:flagellar assembly factor FliW [Anaerobranca californiensis DSM 14826]|jgi:flagellar assembly factor FliW|uniref:Flagellar assembly factor FliW n=1 Tax=Anaerobranca californiensis DSM 14826 TaxID=1120989 RepID=A0A1M6Q1M6_9FIRM|nr:flagellar assembly protein FliW [Anaerobranca californiensis]SHK14122.1 flagellar assembly factor FliW [Anaerobranca californiensis DSM 14826]